MTVSARLLRTVMTYDPSRTAVRGDGWGRRSTPIHNVEGCHPVVHMIHARDARQIRRGRGGVQVRALLKSFTPHDEGRVRSNS
jgi:hypothetical protein